MVCADRPLPLQLWFPHFLGRGFRLSDGLSGSGKSVRGCATPSASTDTNLMCQSWAGRVGQFDHSPEHPSDVRASAETHFHLVRHLPIVGRCRHFHEEKTGFCLSTLPSAHFRRAAEQKKVLACFTVCSGIGGVSYGCDGGHQVMKTNRSSALSLNDTPACGIRS